MSKEMISLYLKTDGTLLFVKRGLVSESARVLAKMTTTAIPPPAN